MINKTYFAENMEYKVDQTKQSIDTYFDYLYIRSKK